MQIRSDTSAEVAATTEVLPSDAACRSVGAVTGSSGYCQENPPTANGHTAPGNEKGQDVDATFKSCEEQDDDAQNAGATSKVLQEEALHEETTTKSRLGCISTEALIGERFSKVLIFGPYWSGTNAVLKEIEHRFNVTVLNPDKLEVLVIEKEDLDRLKEVLAKGLKLTSDIVIGKRRVPAGYRLHPKHSKKRYPTDVSHIAWDEFVLPCALSFEPCTDGSCPWWKHAVHRKPFNIPEDTMAILVTKDPLFWLKSMSKHYYEMESADHSRSGLDGLFQRVRHGGQDFEDAVDLWNKTMESFLDDRLFPSHQCVLLKSEDLLFRFNEVLIHLASFLPTIIDHLKDGPSLRPAKLHGHEVRGREDALSQYMTEDHRFEDFSEKHLQKTKNFNPRVLRELRYEGSLRENDSLKFNPWVPQLSVGASVASFVNVDEPLQQSRTRVWAKVVAVMKDKNEVELEVIEELETWWSVPKLGDWSRLQWPEPPRDAVPKEVPSPQVVPRSWVDLRFPVLDTAETAPLTEEGYRAVVALRSTKQMGIFISRVAETLEVRGARGHVVNTQGLQGFARWFSGEANIQSLLQIRQELPLKEREGWITFGNPPPRPPSRTPAPPNLPPAPSKLPPPPSSKLPPP